jgi:hypothetical protein
MLEWLEEVEVALKTGPEGESASAQINLDWFMVLYNELEETMATCSLQQQLQQRLNGVVASATEKKLMLENTLKIANRQSEIDAYNASE